MRQFRCLLAIVTLALFINVTAVYAKSSQDKTQLQSGLDWVIIRYYNLLNREPYNWTQTQVDHLSNRIFDRSLISGRDSISPLDEKLAQDIYKAQLRANAIHKVLNADIDGDNKVTRDEVRTILRYKYITRQTSHRDAMMQREFDKIMRNDQNRDGAITLDEIRKSMEIQWSLGAAGGLRQRDAKLAPISLDRNGDGELTRDEFMLSVRTIFSEIDTDKDKILTETEIQKFMPEVRKARRRAARERRKTYSARRLARTIMKCRMPDWPKGAKPVFAATYRGHSLANLTFKDSQQLLSVSHLNIEDGPDNLVLILSAPGNVIWQITGTTERVAKVYLGSRFRLGKTANVAITGIDKSKVHFIEASACLPYNFRNEAERKQIAASIGALTGIQPINLIAINKAGKISLPSGKQETGSANPMTIATPASGPGAPLWAAVRRSFPSGIVRLEKKNVFSQTPLTASGVLPGRAGLAQLLDQGAIEIPAGAAKPVTLPAAELRIVAPIQMPAGIGRGVVRKFVLAPNVKIPTGLASQICIVGEADGKPVAGSGRCR